MQFGCKKKTDLRLVDFTGSALKRLGLNNDISASSDYAVTQSWAQAIHDADSQWDGIRYVSRQLNNEYCYAIFARSGLLAQSSAPLRSEKLAELCNMFNVSAV